MKKRERESGRARDRSVVFLWEKLSYYFLAAGAQNEKPPVSARARCVRVRSLRGGPPITKFQLIPRARGPENFTGFGHKGFGARDEFATSRLSFRPLFVAGVNENDREVGSGVASSGR